MTTITNTTNTLVFQKENENAVKQFIMDTLDRNELPNGSLQDMLKDGILLCELIKNFSTEPIIKNERRTKFAYQDNIGQFLRVAETLHIPQSDLFQTVDLLEGKRMQSVISCLLAIQRIMCERKIITKNSLTTAKKNGSTRNLLLLVDESQPQSIYKKKSSYQLLPAKTTPSEILAWPKKLTGNNPRRRVEPVVEEKKKCISVKKTAQGYVKLQVHMITSNNNQLAVTEPARRRLSSDIFAKETKTKKLPLPVLPKPSKSTPIVMAPKLNTESKSKTVTTDYIKKSSQEYNQLEYTNRKTSLKKMGACAIKVECDDGSLAVYALGKTIGKGQFGEVFGGLNMDTGEYVAIKRIRRNQMDCDDMNEVGVLKHLNSEHIVRYVGFSKDKEFLNIILEYVEMGSLHNNIKAFGKFPEKLAASYTFKILSGLHYLHSKDVIHCDLKAANILTTKTGSLKLTDFGVSLSLKMKDDENTGEPAGTPNWMAPEVIKFAGASAKSDIWSLGCTIVEMLTGKPPYAGIPSFTALYRIVEDDEPPIPKNIALSEEARDFLICCFKKNPADRPSAYDLMQSKWMAPYFNQSLSPPDTVKKSKSETYLELSDSETLSDVQDHRATHTFVDYQTAQQGERCYSCHMQMKKVWVRSCQDCQLKFHPHCTNKAPMCPNMPSANNSSKSSSSCDSMEKKLKPKVTPLGPLNGVTGDLKKIYLPAIQQQHKYKYKSEAYIQVNKGIRKPSNSVMT
ncbi:hypothetical protein MFLAVUS_002388 [Mucor flavus]|uniref:Uncharacterized protein n=1 Tax=Mucor flavus TaxID=439312 RepID=A0ABP9YQ46_9FUNG